MKTWVTLLLAISVACPSISHAQRVVARVYGADSVTPMPRVLVEATVALRVVARGLSGSDGLVRLAVPSGESVVLRALRPGFRAVVLPSLVVAVGEAREVSIVLGNEPVMLAPSETRGRRSCGAAISSEAWARWEQARIVLASTLLTEQDSSLQLRTVEYEGWTTAGSAVVVRDSSIREVPVEPLLEPPHYDSLYDRGFARLEGAATRYFAPDPRFLLDERFPERYCLSLTAVDSVPEGFVGLDFAPQRRRRDRLTLVAGRMLLDARGRLRQVEFRYEGLPPAQDVTGVGGYLAFAELASGHWILNEWMLRMPGLVVRMGPNQRFRREDGSYITRADGVTPIEGRPWRSSMELWARARIVFRAEYAGRELLRDPEGEDLARRVVPARP